MHKLKLSKHVVENVIIQTTFTLIELTNKISQELQMLFSVTLDIFSLFDCLICCSPLSPTNLLQKTSSIRGRCIQRASRCLYGERNPIYPRNQVQIFRISLIPYVVVVDLRQSTQTVENNGNRIKTPLILSYLLVV